VVADAGIWARARQLASRRYDAGPRGVAISGWRAIHGWLGFVSSIVTKLGDKLGCVCGHSYKQESTGLIRVG
jgi:hypothetical protein